MISHICELLKLMEFVWKFYWILLDNGSLTSTITFNFLELFFFQNKKNTFWFDLSQIAILYSLKMAGIRFYSVPYRSACFPTGLMFNFELSVCLYPFVVFWARKEEFRHNTKFICTMLLSLNWSQSIDIDSIQYIIVHDGDACNSNITAQNKYKYTLAFIYIYIERNTYVYTYRLFDCKLNL